MQVLIIFLGASLAFSYYIVRSLRYRQRLALPPGPKGLPILGNLNDLPKGDGMECHHWLKHKEKYGPISSITVMGQPIIILNDADMTFELFEKRSIKYSSRPRQLVAGEIIGWKNTPGGSAPNARWRTIRKNLNRIIGTKASAAQFYALQETEIAHFLLNVYRTPSALMDHIQRQAGTAILKMAYGYVAEPQGKDYLIHIVSEAMENFVHAAVPGAFMADIFPWMRFIPEWMPGGGWKKIAHQWQAELSEVTEKPYAFTKYQMSRGEHENSFLSRLLEAGEEGEEEKHTNKFSAMSLYTAGVDSTISALEAFYLAMTIFPEVQRAAQEEIDRVIGSNRLPTMADRENLPYVEALVKEVYRWHPIAPMGIPHTTTDDDIYEGYLIPKGSTIFANVWHFTHDPKVHPDPMTFKPDRFLATNGHEPERDPHLFVWGFGRRVCPGRILADNFIWLTIAQSISVYTVCQVVKDGVPIVPSITFQPGVASRPAKFATSIKLRSPQHEELIRSLESEYPWQDSHSKVLESMA
ncbi:cytochrome P450 [Xylaria bambusicola]|uniref:cytochrome P450 n=1 Tax=Xylaria bambusicola TaxID=326684 RepID=UPI0020086435|nr:cytochrome P450 [Xylaria bambusicola]KAI0516774.1 cytochrome P450 [Xylaria bambusicola]